MCLVMHVHIYVLLYNTQVYVCHCVCYIVCEFVILCVGVCMCVCYVCHCVYVCMYVDSLYYVVLCVDVYVTDSLCMSYCV